MTKEDLCLLTLSGKGHIKMWGWRYVLRDCKRNLGGIPPQQGGCMTSHNITKDHLSLSQVRKVMCHKNMLACSLKKK